jgi:hypothetical protein
MGAPSASIRFGLVVLSWLVAVGVYRAARRRKKSSTQD